MNTTTTTLAAVLRCYSFDVRNLAGREAWRAFERERKASGARPMGPVFHDREASRADDARNGTTITLETAHLFDNQWNATDAQGVGFRAFDWLIEAEAPFAGSPMGAPKGWRQGYYLEQTDEMREARASRAACGYCGKQRPMAGAPKFCPACIGSEYLEPERFHMTRLRPVDAQGDHPPLTEEEQAERLATWKEARRESAKTQAGAKLAAFRARVESKAAKDRENAERERDGFLWLLDHDLGGLACDNVIFYSHTGRFNIGWRNKLDYGLACEIMGKLSDEGFPFPYDVDTMQRGKLSGAVEG